MNYHISLYLCRQPGLLDPYDPQVVWDCGNNDPGLREAGPLAGYTHAGECSEFRSMSYGWSHHAPPLVLPEGRGFRVGGSDGDAAYVVLAIHYECCIKDVFTQHDDDSGLILTLEPQSQEKPLTRVGTIVLDSFGILPPGRETSVEVACRLNDSLTIHPIQFTPHQHDAGRSLSFWKVSAGGEWSFLGKHEHQHHEPQRYYPLDQADLTMEEGDFIAMRCSYNNTDPHKILTVG